MIKAVIFDSDGMITPAKRFSTDLENKFGIPSEKVIPFFLTIFKQCLIGKADLKEELEKQIQIWDCKKEVKDLIKYWFESQSKTNKNIINKIEELKKQGIKCYLATNQEKYRTEYMKKEMGFEDLFDEVFSSADIGSKKPEIVFFEYIYKKINNGSIEKQEIMFWDDEPKHIEAAIKFGFKGYIYKDFEDFEKIVRMFL